MQRHFARLLIATFVSISALGVTACSKAQQAEETEKIDDLPLMLAISERQEWLLVSIANRSPEPILINRLMRPSGKLPELTFYLDGKPAKFNSDTHYFAMPEDLSNPSHSLGAQQSYGMIIRRSNLITLFEFPKGSCKEVQVRYKDVLGVEGAYQGELASNKLKVCV
jgi:hypothetical protein